VLGLVGMALALRLRPLRPGVARVLPLALLIVGYGLTDRLVVPRVLASEPRLCAEARAVAAAAAAQKAGSSAGALTVIEAVTADCDERVLVTAQTVAAARADINPDSLAGAQSAFIADT